MLIMYAQKLNKLKEQKAAIEQDKARYEAALREKYEKVTPSPTLSLTLPHGRRIAIAIIVDH